MDIIRNALATICGLANAHMQALDRRADDWVVLTSLVDHAGDPNMAASDKIVMTVYNLTQETMVSSYRPVVGGEHGTGDAYATVAPPLYIDVHLMVMANFATRNYADGLAALSRLIDFFRCTPSFTPHNAPGLTPEINKLVLELQNLVPADVSRVMAMVGTPYLPSVFYKLRMIPFVSATMPLQPPQQPEQP
jgi:Pvc16 N-terminal domain